MSRVRFRSLCLFEMRDQREISTERLKCGEAGAPEWQFPWMVSRVYFEVLSKLA